MCQKQWKSLWKLKNFTFSIPTRVLLFLKNYQKYRFSQFIWIGPCKGFGAFSQLQRNLWCVYGQLVACSQLLKFEYYRGRVTKTKDPPWDHRLPPWDPLLENELPAGDVWQKLFYKKKPLKRPQVYHHRPLFPQIGAFRFVAPTGCIHAFFEFEVFLTKMKKLQKHYYSNAKWISGPKSHFGVTGVLAVILKEKKNIEKTLVFVTSAEIGHVQGQQQ